MCETDPIPASFVRDGDTMTVEIQRAFEAAAGQVWAALTEPQDLVQWLAPGMIEPRLGGAVRLDFADSGAIIDSLVCAYAPGRLLAYDWGGPNDPPRPLTWRIESEGDETRLTLTLVLPAKEDAARAAAGWAAHLEMLAAALAGVPIRFPFPYFQRARETYREQTAARA